MPKDIFTSFLLSQKTLLPDIYLSCSLSLFVLITRLCLWRGLFLTIYTVHGMLQDRILEWVAFSFSKDLPSPGIEPRSPAQWADYLPVELQGKPENTGVGSLSLLQWIFLTQELNWGLLHCRWILYQLSYSINLTPYPILCFFID